MARRLLSSLFARLPKLSVRPRRAPLDLVRLDDRITPTTVTWDGGGGADTFWNNPLNWDTDAVPGAKDDVVIGTGAIARLVPDDVAIRSLDNRGTLSVERKLTVTADSANSGTMTLFDTATLGSGSTFTNGAGATLILKGGVTGGTLKNAGTIRKEMGGSFNQITIASLFNMDATGTVEVVSGNLYVDGGGAASGTFTVIEDGGLVFSGSAYVLNSDSTVTGSFVRFASKVTVAGMLDVVEVEALNVLFGVDVAFTGTVNLEGRHFRVGGGTVDFTDANGGDPIEIGSLTAGNATIIGNADLRVTGSVLIDHPTYLNGTGTVYFDRNTADDDPDDGDVYDVLIGDLYMNRPVEWVGSVRASDIHVGKDLTLTNPAGAELDFYGIIHTDTGANFVNEGMLRVTSKGNATIRTPFEQTATGSTRIESGALVLTGGGTADGIFTGDPATELAFRTTGGFTFAADSVLTLDNLNTDQDVTINGTATITGLIISSTKTLAFNGPTELTGVDLFIHPNFGGTLDLTGADLGGPLTLGDVDLGGTLLSDDEVHFPGQFQVYGNNPLSGVRGGGTFHLDANPAEPASFFNLVSLDGTLVNNRYLSVWALLSLAPDAKLHNAAGGTVEVQNDTQFVGIDNTSIVNDGLFRKTVANYSITLSQVNPAFTNTGTVRSEDGTLRFLGAYTQTAGATVAGAGELRSDLGFDILGGELSGNGLLRGAVRMTGGTFNPGTVTIQDGAYTQSDGATFKAALGPGVVGKLVANASPVTLGGELLLAPVAGFKPAIGTSFRIIDNDGTDKIVGTFVSKPEGTDFLVGGVRYRISYKGGTNYNDVTVKVVSAPPVLSNVPSGVVYVENKAPTRLAPAANLSDPDSPNFLDGKLTVAITANGSASDRLTVLSQGFVVVSGSSVSFDGNSIGTLTGGTGTSPLVIQFNSSAATVAAVRAVLRNVAFENASENATVLNRTIQFSLTDGDTGISTPVLQGVSLTPVNDPPALGGIAASRNYTENAILFLAPLGTVADIDSPDFAGGKLTVSHTGISGANDRLAVRHQGNAAGQVGVSGNTVSVGGVSVGTFTGGVGTSPLVITFNASATKAAAQAVLRRVVYELVFDNPTVLSRSVKFTLTDGDGGTSPAVTQTIAITPVNDAPVLSGIAASASYVENATLVLAPVGTVADADSLDFEGGKLTVALTANAGANDRLVVRHQGNAAGQVGVIGSDVTFGGIAVGIFEGGIGTSPLVVTFNAATTKAAVQAVLRNVAYQLLFDNPTILTRNVRFTLSDGDGGTSLPVNHVLTIVPVNDAPALGNIVGPRTYPVLTAPVALAPTGTVTDTDSPNFDTGKLTVRITGNGGQNDRLAVRNQGINPLQIGVNGSNITFGGTVIGSFTGGSAITSPLVVTFNASATRAAVQSVLRNVTFANVSATPATAPRTIRLTLSDGDGGISTPVDQFVNLVS